MKQKILITGGDSYSCWWRKGYKENNILTWPDLIEKTSDRFLLNTATIGASNGLIENRVFDAIQKYKNHDIVVMILWTDIYRINYADNWKHRTIFPRNYDIVEKDLEFYKALYEKSFRSMRRTKFICEHYGIPWHFRSGSTCNPVYTDKIFLSALLEDWLSKHPIQKEMGMSWKELMYGCTSAFPRELWMSVNDVHPNQHGQQRIADMFTSGKCDVVKRTTGLVPLGWQDPKGIERLHD